MVFTEKPLGNKSKIKHRGDLEDEFGLNIRANEGEAANYGIFYDDSEYDYMQHMRDLSESGDTFFIESTPVKTKKGKGKRLEDALRDLDLDARSESGLSLTSGVSTTSMAESLFGREMAESEFVRKTTYQDMQDVPDTIAGFQPDMDPRLQEVLEALDDEAYVDDDEDIFEALQEGAEEVSLEEWEASRFDHVQDDGWESDHTIKAIEEHHIAEDHRDGNPGAEISEHGDADWMAEFSKFKKDIKARKTIQPTNPGPDAQSLLASDTSSLMAGRRKKRKGALTSSTGYSMSSSALARTAEQNVLDRRFEKIEEEYNDDENLDDSASLMSGMTGLSTASSQAPQLVRSDFETICDDFLGNYSKSRRRKPQTGMEQLDEIRKGLGPARIKTIAR
jgi:protein LTV1